MAKICHLTSVHNNRDGRIFKRECSSLAKAGHEVFLIGQGNGGTENDVTLITITPPKNRIYRMLKTTNEVYKKAIEIDADIYHLHDPELLTVGLKLKRRNKKVIFDSHEDTLNQMMDKEWIPQVIRPLVAIAYKFYAQKCMKKLDALVCVTPVVYRQLKEINNNTFMITNYPELRLNNEHKTLLVNKGQLCFTGEICKEWGIDILIDCIEELQNTSLVMCGRANQSFLDFLKNKSGWEKVNYMGYVSFEESLYIQSQSEIGVALLGYVSIAGGKEGNLGNTKLFEYMMAGKPVICTDSKVWKDIVDKWKCGICVNPYDRDEIKAAIEFLMNNPKKAHEMGRNGRAAVEKELNWCSQEQILINMYNELILQ